MQLDDWIIPEPDGRRPPITVAARLVPHTAIVRRANGQVGILYVECPPRMGLLLQNSRTETIARLTDRQEKVEILYGPGQYYPSYYDLERAHRMGQHPLLAVRTRAGMAPVTRTATPAPVKRGRDQNQDLKGERRAV